MCNNLYPAGMVNWLPYWALIIDVMELWQDGRNYLIRSIADSKCWLELWQCRTSGMLQAVHRTAELSYMGFEVFTAVVMKSVIFWDVTLCGPLKVNRRLGWTYRIHLQGWISRARYQHESRWQACFYAIYLLGLFDPEDGSILCWHVESLLSCWYLASLILPCRWKQYVHLKRRLTFNGLHGVISQKIVLFNSVIILKGLQTCKNVVGYVRPNSCSCEY
jgi:hypothetical protein